MKRKTKTKSHVAPKAGPRLEDVPREYGKHEYQVRIQGKREEFFPFATESAAKGCFMGAQHPKSRAREVELMKRKGSGWTVLNKWRAK